MAHKKATKRTQLFIIGIFFVLLAALSGNAQAAVNQWSVDGPFGATITAVVVNQTVPDNVYVGIDGLGVYYSDDGGASWTEFNTGLTDQRVQTLYIADYLPDVNPVGTLLPVLYAGTNGGGVFRTEADPTGSVDAWEDISNDLPNKFVLSFFAHPDDVNEAYVGTNGGGVFRTTNVDDVAGSVTWTEMNTGLGNRIVFDLELPRPISNITINEVDITGGGNDYVELFGLPNQSLGGYTLVLVDSLTEDDVGIPVLPHSFDVCDPAHPSPSYAHYELLGSMDSRGRYVIGAAGPGVDQVEPGFQIPDRTMGIALYAETGISDFVPGGDFTCAAPGVPTTSHGLCFEDADCDDGGSAGFCNLPGWLATDLNLIDAVIVDTGSDGGDQLDRCMWASLGFNAQYEDSGAFGSVSRYPDGGDVLDTERWFGNLAFTPDTYNRPLDTIWAATDVRGVYRSDDRGGFWVPFNNELAFDVAFDLTIDPVDPDPNCGLSLYTTYVGTSGGGVFKNTDPCDFNTLDDWLSISEGLEDDTILTMEVGPTIPGSGLSSFIFTGTESGQIYRSHDDGGSWNEVSNGLGGLGIESIGVDGNRNPLQDPFRPSEIYTGTIGGGVYKTVDSGSNWFQTSPDLESLIGVFVRSVVVDPRDPIPSPPAPPPPADPPISIIYAGTFGGGVFQGLVEPGGLDPNFFEVAWTDVNNGLGSLFIWDLAIDPTTPDTLFAATDTDGVYKTLDNGANWADSSTGLPVDNLSILELELVDSNTLYLTNGDLYDTVDAGATWSQVDTTDLPDDTTILTVAVDPQVPANIYIGTQNDGVYKSDDTGDNWIEINNGLNDSFIRDLLVDPSDSNIVYAATDGAGIFRSLNGGINWAEINNGLLNQFVLTLAIDPVDPSVIYAGTDDGGVYKTNDGGGNWFSFNRGLTNFVTQDIAIDPSNPDRVHIGTEGGGVFNINQVDLLEITLIGPFYEGDASVLRTSEEGESAVFTVRLPSVPNSNVLVTLSSSNNAEGVVDPESLVFTPANSDIAQTVTVTGLDDGQPEADDVSYLVQVAELESSDPLFDGFDPDDVPVVNVSNPGGGPPGVTVNPTSGLVTTEGGGTDTFTVALDTLPDDDVTINLTSSDTSEATISPATLVFTSVDGTTPQIVTVTGVEDGIADGDQNFDINSSLTLSSDPNYSGLLVPSVNVTNTDSGNQFFLETATLGTTGQTSGILVSSTNFIGAKFTTVEEVDVTSFGVHIRGTGTLFAAVVPLDGSDFPADFNLSAAVFSTTFSPSDPSSEVIIPATFTMPAGRYALIIGSGLFGATGSGSVASGQDSNIGSPEYFIGNPSTTTWTDGVINNIRFFLVGSATTLSSVIFEDGFESGDAANWSNTVPFLVP